MLMLKLWSEDFVTFEGEYLRTKKATLYDRPPGGVPVYIAATGEATARLAGRMADGFICTSGKGAELYRDTLLPAVDEGARKAGRDPSTIERLIEVKVSFDTDAKRALENTRYWAALALPAEQKVGVEDSREMERLAAQLLLEKVSSRWIVSSDADEHVARIGEYVALGFTHLVFHAPSPDQGRFLDLYAEHIVPRLRERYS